MYGWAGVRGWFARPLPRRFPGVSHHQNALTAEHRFTPVALDLAQQCEPGFKENRGGGGGSKL